MRLKFGGLWFFVLAVCLLGGSPDAFSERDAPAAPAAGPEKEVVFILSVTNAPKDVRAFGFDLLYPGETMTFEKADKGELANTGFLMFGANALGPGKVRIGGVATGENYMKKGATGELVVLTFKASGDEPAVFDMVDVKDDMKGWSFSGNTAAPLDAASALNIRKKAVSVKP